MTVQATCKSCGKNIRAKDKYAGKTVKCPQCKKPVKFAPSEDEQDIDWDALAQMEQQGRSVQPSRKSARRSQTHPTQKQHTTSRQDTGHGDYVSIYDDDYRSRNQRIAEIRSAAQHPEFGRGRLYIIIRRTLMVVGTLLGIPLVLLLGSMHFGVLFGSSDWSSPTVLFSILFLCSLVVVIIKIILSIISAFFRN